jgi:oxygen-independent coproporphyrinogen-3 oxidase
LEPEQLDRLLTHLETHFSYKELKEITVEAGRPDSITRQKLEVLKAHNIGRISINPQTMQQKTLDIIGRKHTVEDIRRVYAMAREIGFDNINMDLIAGLPEETVEDMQDTLEQIKEMAPDSLTVHALAMKRASRMTQEQKLKKAQVLEQQQGLGIKSECEAETANTLSQMIELASNYANQMGLEPYYLYRQSRMVGNMENTGWSKDGFDGLYNVYIMDETHTILACGAGAVTKLKDPLSGNIERIFNFKYPYEYNDRFEELLERKKGITDFYMPILPEIS